MKKFALILSIVLNIVLAGSIGVNAKHEPEVVEVPVEVEKIVEVPVEKVVEKVVEVPVEKVVEVEKIVEVEKETEHAFVHNKYIIGKYEKGMNGDIVVEFSDYSWAIINHETNEYIFQPACMGDWDMTFKNFEQLKMAMETYFQGAEVTIQEPEQLTQSAESKTLNPDNIYSIEKELAKVPDAVKKLLIENGVEIYIQDGLGENFKEGVFTHGVYYWDTNKIVMNASDNSIEYALIHEIGHALDDILGIDTEKIWESYESQEIEYDNEHYYSEIREYVAEGVQGYYNGTLEKNTTMYNELNNILGGIK